MPALASLEPSLAWMGGVPSHEHPETHLPAPQAKLNLLESLVSLSLQGAQPAFGLGTAQTPCFPSSALNPAEPLEGSLEGEMLGAAVLWTGVGAAGCLP